MPHAHPGRLPEFVAKMTEEGLAPIVIDTFAYYYDKVLTGETGMIRDADIDAIKETDIPRYQDLSAYENAGRSAFSRSVRIILNGGLGTSMGLTGPKSLLPVKNGRTFLEMLLSQSGRYDVTLALMNSFSTHAATLAAIEQIDPARMPLCFLQHKFPKILQDGFGPAAWPENPELEWNPPGHGDIYTALETSGMLDQLLDAGIVYAFISNSDNLGASMDERLLGYFADTGLPFMMEAATRTPADVKGGHLARAKTGGLLLRESAQCPDGELDAFRDINRYRFFNTNNLWVNLAYLKTLITEKSGVRLPMILNPKRLDPRDDASPRVFQVETAMGAAISLFPGASAVCVPRTRFFPVKKCNDLLVVRSDYVALTDDDRMVLNPDRRSEDLKVSLDPEFYEKIDRFDARFPEGIPSLAGCESLTVRGDVRFEADVAIRGRAIITNHLTAQAVVKKGTVVEGSLML